MTKTIEPDTLKELLDDALAVSEAFDQMVLTHPLCQKNQEIHEAVLHISNALGALYQLIGKASLDEPK